MKTYKIEVQETLSKVIEIRAESIGEAISIARDKHTTAEIVLNYNDFLDVDFIDVDSAAEYDEKSVLVNEIIDYLIEDEKRHFEELEIEPKSHIYKKLIRLKSLL